MIELVQQKSGLIGSAQAIQELKKKDSKSGKYGISVYEPDWSQETLQSVMDKYENGIIRQALDQYGGNISRTAEALDIKRQSLQYRIHKYGIII